MKLPTIVAKNIQELEELIPQDSIFTFRPYEDLRYGRIYIPTKTCFIKYIGSKKDLLEFMENYLLDK